MPNSFCRYLSNGYSFSRGKVGIRVFPCGLVKGSVHLDSATVDHRKTKYNSISVWKITADVQSAKLKQLLGKIKTN